MTSLPDRVLWTTDLSELSLQSGRYAAGLARRLGAELCVVHVFEPPSTPDAYPTSPAGEGQVNSEVAVLGACRDRLSHVVAEEIPESEDITAEVIFGEPWRAICEYAEAEAIGLIVISTHGGSRLRHALVGSTAERVLQHAPCPVLVVKTPPRRAVAGQPRPLCKEKTDDDHHAQE